ncbi:MAG: inorganic phosphate transporter [Betaproteobacteria bacterium]|nr:inorganic phosphate transporter [Betaproteobacteria bacterium]
MTELAAPLHVSQPTAHKPNLNASSGMGSAFIFFGVLVAGVVYTAYSLYADVTEAQVRASSLFPFLLLGVALFIALGFEFVNGFHDTANAVATVIYTHSLQPHFAVVWSGTWNFLGVLFSSGAVAFGIISLLPVELILQVGSSAGFAMVFALLIAAIIWNVGTWYLGLPASSSHTLIGSIIGVGLANQLMRAADGTSGVDWSQAAKIGYSLVLSPLVGFVCAAVLLLTLKFLVNKPALYREPEGRRAPPWWIRGILVLTCTGVSFAHGSNDGQKGMGLIMLILIGTVPAAYALNRAMPDSQVTQFLAIAHVSVDSLRKQAGNVPAPADARKAVTEFVRTRKAAPDTIPALAALGASIADNVQKHGSMRKMPADTVQNVRNDMYLASEAIRFLAKSPDVGLDVETAKNLAAFKTSLDNSTKFIPLWVKVAVAIALGLGTMVGWKRIVVTVGEKIGKSHLTYAQGASAELVAMGTIAAADLYGLPVSTTHVLASGVAGTMAANKSGLQMATIRNLLMAWVLTLPAAILLSGTLYYVFSKAF